MSGLKVKPPHHHLSTQTFYLQIQSNRDLNSKFGPKWFAKEHGLPMTLPRSTLTFNKDKLHFTPTFLRPCEQGAAMKLEGKYRREFESQIEDTNMKGEIMQPKPSIKHCFVCKEKFSDYNSVQLFQQQHIGNKIHIDNEKKSKANRYIYDLVEEVSQKGKKRGEAHRRRREERSEVTVERETSVQHQNSTILTNQRREGQYNN